jgi:4-amino-4-deoxy-L-arabinose transferase-like glycosyltransferase
MRAALKTVESVGKVAGTPVSTRHHIPARAIHLLLLACAALFLGLTNVSGSGFLWPDSARYAHGGAMVRDLLAAGEFSRPIAFARQNYSQYPFFNIPYHPPGMAVLLGTIFWTLGTSYLAARVFIAVCAALAVCSYYSVLVRAGAAPLVSAGSSLLLLTSPEVARWSRDTMSEVPALAFLMLGAYFFLVWLDSGKPFHIILAFSLAEAAFFCRITTAAVVAGWIGFTIIAGYYRKLLSVASISVIAIFGIVNLVWIWFASGYSHFETQSHSRPDRVFIDNLIPFYFARLPQMTGFITPILFVAGLAAALYLFRRNRLASFWLVWLFSCCVCVQVLRLRDENRYFLFALPALAGFIPLLFPESGRKAWLRWTASAVLALAIVWNTVELRAMPSGVVGYGKAAYAMAALPLPGNILLGCARPQDLAFYYRAANPVIQRRLIRSDRSLAIRVADYYHVPATVVAHDRQSVLEIIRRGRVRYIVTTGPSPQRSEETALLHDTAASSSQEFKLLGHFPVLDEFVKTGSRADVFLWQFTGTVPPGPSELPTPIPTAGISIAPTF